MRKRSSVCPVWQRRRRSIYAARLLVTCARPVSHRKRGLLVVTINEVEPPLMPQWRLFREAIRWIIKAYTNESLTMMYEAVRGAPAADDATERQGGEPNSRSGKRLIGRNTPPVSRPRC